MDRIITIEHSNRNTKEFGYGLYINGVYHVDGYTDALLASECLPKTATDSEIKRAESRVRQKALRQYHKLCKK